MSERLLTLESIVSQHVEESAFLYAQRVRLTHAPHVKLSHLQRLDERLAAHLDGIAVAGEHGWRASQAALTEPSAGAAFAATVRAVADGSNESLEQLFGMASGTPEVRLGVIGAFGWLGHAHLAGIVASLLRADDPLRRLTGLTACTMHRVDPGLASGPWIRDVDPAVRTMAIRAAGELGLKELMPYLVAAISSDDSECRFWSIWSAVLLGSRGKPLDEMVRAGLTRGTHSRRAFVLALQCSSVTVAYGLLKELARDPEGCRDLIQGSGINGDPAYVSWLIGHMASHKTARVAGEAFTLITGADLDVLQLWCSQPEHFESGPNEEPSDPDVDLDPDEGLLWPDQRKIEQWWSVNASRFQKGARYFLGAPVTREHCLDVLKNGYQRQRILAAHYLCLLNPVTQLFNTSAPAWRQQRLLAQM